MFPTKLIAGFFGRFVVYFIALMLAWQIVAPLYRPFFCEFGEFLFGSFGAHTQIQFLPLDTKVDSVTADTRLNYTNHITGAAANNNGRSGFTGYQPTAFVISLVLATPIPWRRRLRSLLWAIPLVHVFIALRILVLVLGDLSRLGWIEFGDISQVILDFSSWIIVGSFGGSFVLPVGIWFWVTFRRSDWDHLLKKGGSKNTSSATKTHPT